MGYAHGKHWNDKEIEDRIMQIVKDRNMSTFPTLDEMSEYYGDWRLRNKVAKTGGSFMWAERLGLPMKQSDTCFGREYEFYAIKDIFDHTTQHMNAEKMGTKYPYDLLVEGCIKVDVKASRPIGDDIDGKSRYSFNLEKKHPTCDIYLLYGLDKDGNVLETFIIPSIAAYGISQVNIGVNKRCEMFLDRWDLFVDYLNFHRCINEKYPSLDDIDYKCRRRMRSHDHRSR